MYFDKTDICSLICLSKFLYLSHSCHYRLGDTICRQLLNNAGFDISKYRTYPLAFHSGCTAISLFLLHRMLPSNVLENTHSSAFVRAQAMPIKPRYLANGLIRVSLNEATSTSDLKIENEILRDCVRRGRNRSKFLSKFLN